MSLGLILAKAACRAQRHVSWYPSYGPEQRGGTANCSVVISGSAIGSPIVYESNILIAMNRPSLEKFAMDVNPGGVILYDSTIGEYDIPEGVRGIAVPAMEIACKAKAEKAANTVMLGVLKELGVTKLPADVFAEALAENFAGKQKLIDINKKVLEAEHSGSEITCKDKDQTPGSLPFFLFSIAIRVFCAALKSQRIP